MHRKNSSTAPFKAEAKALRKYLSEQGIELRHSKCLEAVSRMRGFKNWDTACAAAQTPQPSMLPPELPPHWEVREIKDQDGGFEAHWGAEYQDTFKTREEAVAYARTTWTAHTKVEWETWVAMWVGERPVNKFGNVVVPEDEPPKTQLLVGDRMISGGEARAPVVAYVVKMAGPPPLKWRVHVMVKHRETGAMAFDYFDGNFTDAQIEVRAAQMAKKIQKDLSGGPVEAMEVKAWVTPEEAGPKPIIINGKRKEFTGDYLSYEDLVKGTFGGLPPEGQVMSVAFKGVDRFGTLTPGQTVRVEPGMAFNVIDMGHG